VLFDAGASRRQEIFVMASAHVIEVGDITAGIVVFERGGFRFFAAERAFHPLEGALFRTIDRATRAARERLRPRKRRSHRSLSSNPSEPDMSFPRLVGVATPLERPDGLDK
jgi:hypothetical protein